MRSRKLLATFVVSLLVATGACAAGAGGGGGGNVMTELQITEAQLNAGEPVYEMLERARPNWLRPPQSLEFEEDDVELVVQIDGVDSGGIQQLRSLPTGRVAELRFLSPDQAATRGPQYRGGIIQVTMRP